MNQPNRIDSWILEDDQKPLTIVEDPKIPNAASITIRKQDHTLGNMIRAQLLLDPSVLFAGYKVPHPLENDILLKIQTDDRSNPAEALKRACQLLIQQTLEVKKQFSEQARNVEMGIAGEQVGVPGGLGGYDPYGDGLGAGGAGREGGDVYDF
ncbi:putative DNA-directed RNA polymerase ii 13.3 kDa polypeptide [Papiliotrema laurentii]|uniref:DNA-directed RNA polymerase ii 13.3 kDa polypeptide n=1 Tax=Papiliotrema laurentii TaxID=5418 RepID=A0AAD9FRV8_PAPLA|nr:putative DNA-directed RNA polymerase ii 13.3 kDa polypeptide [Papiliotrema laurentii]